MKSLYHVSFLLLLLHLSLGKTCNYYVSFSGSDLNVGTSSGTAFRTVSKLVTVLSAGKIGCLSSGQVFQEDVDIRSPVTGTAAYPIIITSVDNSNPAMLTGRLVTHPGSDHITICNLRLNGTKTTTTNSGGLPQITIGSSYITLSNNQIFNGHCCIGINILNDPQWGVGRYTLIDSNIIHEIGKVPSQNQDHGIYDIGISTTIRNNWIYDCIDRGVQLRGALTAQVYNNIIDSNGEGVMFSTDEMTSSSNDDVFNNIISNSQIRWLAEEFWATFPVGMNNTLRANCLWPTSSDSYYNSNNGITNSDGGFADISNVKAQPIFQSASQGIYCQTTASNCRAYGPPATQPIGPQMFQCQSTPTPKPTPKPTPAPGACTHYANTLSGSDSNLGTSSGSAFKTARKLVSVLRAGNTGCLQEGQTFVGDLTISPPTIGTSTRPVTIKSTNYLNPAKINGQITIQTGSNYITISTLILDATRSSTVNTAGQANIITAANFIRILNNEIINGHTASGITFNGNNSVIDSNIIHNIGAAATNSHNCVDSRGYFNTIKNNWLYDCTDRGVQLTSSFSSSVFNNVIDRDGSGVLYGAGRASSNAVYNNTISNAQIRWLAEDYWGSDPVGTMNTLNGNCIYPSNPTSSYYNSNNGIYSSSGFSSANNKVAKPIFQNAQSGQYCQASNSPCFSYGVPPTQKLGPRMQSC